MSFESVTSVKIEITHNTHTLTKSSPTPTPTPTPTPIVVVVVVVVVAAAALLLLLLFVAPEEAPPALDGAPITGVTPDEDLDPDPEATATAAWWGVITWGLTTGESSSLLRLAGGPELRET